MNLREVIKKSPLLLGKLAALGSDPFPDTPVLFAKIKLLWKCNLSCTFCNAWKRHEKGMILSMKDTSEILMELREHGLKKVHFSGGEVLLHPQIMEILEFSCTMGLQVNITSNGTLMTGEIVKSMAAMGLHSISISLDSCRPGVHDRIRGRKGAFKAAVKAMRYILKYRKKGPRLRVNTVVTSKNFEDLQGIHQLLMDMDSGIRWKLIPVDSGKKKLLLSTEMIRELFRISSGWELLEGMPRTPGEGSLSSMAKGRYASGYYRRHKCYMPWIHLFIDPRGFIYTCCMARSSMEPMGRMPEEPLASILSGAGARELKRRMALDSPYDICHSCDDFISENRDISKLISKVKQGK